MDFLQHLRSSGGDDRVFVLPSGVEIETTGLSQSSLNKFVSGASSGDFRAIDKVLSDGLTRIGTKTNITPDDVQKFFPIDYAFALVALRITAFPHENGVFRFNYEFEHEEGGKESVSVEADIEKDMLEKATPFSWVREKIKEEELAAYPFPVVFESYEEMLKEKGTVSHTFKIGESEQYMEWDRMTIRHERKAIPLPAKKRRNPTNQIIFRNTRYKKPVGKGDFALTAWTSAEVESFKNQEFLAEWYSTIRKYEDAKIDTFVRGIVSQKNSDVKADPIDVIGEPYFFIAALDS